ncbi:MAG: acyl-CoA dehydrogenase family protein, partial [Salinisphaera sp.]|nr:acyl-CoA dehydrogenase family protein [Salinisphaera sp.]
MLRDAAARFADERLRPAAAEADAAACARQGLLDEAAELGLASLAVPEALDGAGGEHSPVTGALIGEALAHGDMGLAAACLAPVAVANALFRWGDADQQSAYLAPFAGETPPVAALAVAESHPLPDPLALTCRASGQAGDVILDGVKALVPRAAAAEFFLIAAQPPAGGPQLYIVERGTAGVRVSAEPAMGLRAACTGRLELNQVRLPAAARLGGARGCHYGELLALSRLAWCALAAGTGQAVLDYVTEYVNERTAFGEPVSHRQAVAFMVADIAIELEGMRLATWRAAALAEAGKSFQREAALAHRLAARHGMAIGSAGVQLLGGHGFIKDHPVERWYRDLRAVGLMEGGVLL